MSAMVHVIGAPGSGKSTVAAAIARRLDIPHYSIDEERLPLIRPGDHWPWGRDQLAWRNLMAKARASDCVVETLGATDQDAPLEAAAERVLRVVVTAPDEVRRQRLADRVTDGYLFARQRGYVSRLLAMRPLLKADIETDGDELTPVISACREWLAQ